jgi:hypothetical protein
MRMPPTKGGHLFRTYELKVGLFEFLLHHDAGPQVVEDPYACDLLARPVTDEGGRKQDGDLLSCLIDDGELERDQFSDPSVFRAPESLHHLFGHSLRVDVGDMDLPDHLLSLVSGEGFGPFIEDEDVSLHVSGDNAVHGTLNQVHEELVRLPELFLNPFPL